MDTLAFPDKFYTGLKQENESETALHTNEFELPEIRLSSDDNLKGADQALEQNTAELAEQVNEIAQVVAHSAEPLVELHYLEAPAETPADSV